MRCFDAYGAFWTFSIFGAVLVLFPKTLRDGQIFLRSKIPLGKYVPFGGIMTKNWYVTLTRIQGIFFIAFALFLLQWYLRHCR